MKLLKRIYDKPLTKGKKIDRRTTARAILFDENNLIPILFVSTLNYHKLPGGGTENPETIMQALKRELLEETGCEAKIEGEVGKIIEYRSKFNLLQTSYCYFGKVLKKGKLNLTEEESLEDFKLIWVSLDEAMSMIDNDKPLDYEGVFIQKRDMKFLREFQKVSLLTV